MNVAIPPVTGGRGFRRAAILIWIGCVVAAVLVVSRLPVTTDMTAFLPRTTSPAQRVLVDQLRDGAVSRLVLVAIEGVPADRSAAISKRLAARLRDIDDVDAVQNGEVSHLQRDRSFLWSHRYLLSDQVVPGRFSTEALRQAFQADLAALGSTTGFLIEPTLGADPTGEMLHLIEQQIAGGGGPARYDGVWGSADGGRSLMLVRLHAGGSDIDGAQRTLASIRIAFAQAAAATEDRTARLVLTGPPVFAVEARDRIRSDASRLSAVAGGLVAVALLAVYRSPLVLVLALIPVVSGALAGIAAVGLTFSTVHGITLGFGATLIGEAVDYAVYLFTQTAPDSPVERTLARIWPTLRLGVLASICGFSAMLLSSFEGFAQLGLFTITGLAVAVCVTRWVLPALVPASFAGVRQSAAIMRLSTFALGAWRLRIPLVLLTAVAGASLALGPGVFWAGDLASLSPVPPAQQELDRSLRQDMRMPDTATLIVLQKPDQEAALAAAERITAALVPVMERGGIAGIDSPARYLPSVRVQRLRQAALPSRNVLQMSLDAALDGLPFRAEYFAPFVADVDRQRSMEPISRTDLDGTAVSQQVDSLLLNRAGGVVATVGLRGVTAASAIATSVAGEPNAVLVNLKAESDRLLRMYLSEGATLAGLGAGAIGLLLLVSLRSWRRIAIVAAPLMAAVVVTLAILRLGGHALSVFNLFGMLLVVAIGSNYCLFLDRMRTDPAGAPRVLASLLFANACTVTGFGVLAISDTPVLHDLGLPVAAGTFLSLVFAVIIMAPPDADPDAIAG